MSSVSIPLVEMGKTIEETVQNLYDAYHKLARTVEHGFLTIDSTNIKELDGKSVKVKNIEAKSIITDQLIVGTNVALGTAVTATGVTTIIDGRITTDYLNAIGIAAESIVGTYITGKTIQTSPPGNVRMTMDSSGLYAKNASNYLDGVCVLGGSNYFKSLDIYTDGNLAGQLVYDDYGTLSLSTSYASTLRLYSYLSIKLESAYLGFFGVTPATKQSAALLSTPGSYSYTAGAIYTSNEQGMLNAMKQDINDLKNKQNGVIEKIGLYGLFTVT